MMKVMITIQSATRRLIKTHVQVRCCYHCYYCGPVKRTLLDVCELNFNEYLCFACNNYDLFCSRESHWLPIAGLNFTLLNCSEFNFFFPRYEN